jgi:hypothetical protein
MCKTLPVLFVIGGSLKSSFETMNYKVSLKRWVEGNSRPGSVYHHFKPWVLPLAFAAFLLRYQTWVTRTNPATKITRSTHAHATNDA